MDITISSRINYTPIEIEQAVHDLYLLIVASGGLRDTTRQQFEDVIYSLEVLPSKTKRG